MESTNKPKVVALDGDLQDNPVNDVKIDPVPVTPEMPFQDPTDKPTSVEDLVAADMPEIAEAIEKIEQKSPEKESLKKEPVAETAPVEPEPAGEEPADGTKKNVTEEQPAESDENDDVLEELRKPDLPKRPSRQDLQDRELIVNQVLLGKRDELMEDLRKFYPDSKATDAAAKDENSLFNAVISASVSGWNTGARNSYEEVLTLNNKFGNNLVEQNKCEVKRVADGRPKDIHHTSVKVSGKEARLLMRARLGGLCRINLLNSGFWVAIRAPLIAELNELFTTIDLEGKEIGRTIGAHYALISDMYLKKKFVEMLISKKIIIESNFRNIYENGAFVRNLSIHDYDVLMHGIVMLMAKNGLRTRLVCPKCGDISVEQNIDVSACKELNMDLMTDKHAVGDNGKELPSVREWWSAAGKNDKGETIYRTESDLRLYREKILGFNRVITQNMNGSNGQKFEVVLHAPTCNQFFQVGQMLIDQLNATIASLSNGEAEKEDLVRQALTIQGYQLITPWIKELRGYKDDGKTIDFTIEDHSVIIEYLDSTIQEDESEDLFKELNQFVADSRFNYIGCRLLHCPKCGVKPESDLDTFFPLDVQTIFFGLLFRLLGSAR